MKRLCAWCCKKYNRIVPWGHWCCLQCFDKWKKEYE